MAQILAGGSEPNAGGNTEVITQVQTATWTQLQGKPNIEVSSKGIVNGLSNIPNDGVDFGPDTTSGATALGQYGGTYTETTGIQEAVNYISTFYQVTLGSTMPVLHLLNQHYYLSTDVVFPAVVKAQITTWSIVGEGRFNTDITLDSGCEYGLNFSGLQPYEGSGANITLQGLTIRVVGSSITSHVNAQLPSGSGNNEFSAYDIQIAGSSTYGIAISNVQLVTCDLFDNADILSSAGWMTFGGVIETITLLRQSAFSAIFVNCTSLNYFRFNSIFSDVAIIFNDPVQTVEIEGENHNQITYQGAANVKFIRLRNYTYINASVSSPFYVNTGYQPIVEVDGFYYNIPSGTVPFYELGSGGVNPVMSSVKNVFNIGTGTITMPPTSITLPANPPISGTVYQNTNPYDIEIDLPVYATTAGTAGYVTVAKGSTSTPTAIGNQFVNGSTSSTSVDIIRLRVPAGWYYEFTASGVTFGTASVFAD